MAESTQYEAIRRAVATLRIRAMQMSDKIPAPYFKESLVAVRRDLDLVESFVLRQAQKAQTKNGEALWLHVASLRVQTAVATLQGIQDAVDRYGYEIHVIDDE